MAKIIIVLGLVIVAVVVYVLFFARKSENGALSPVEQLTEAMGEINPAPAMQGELDTREQPAQIGITTGSPEITSSKDAVRSLLSGDLNVGEDAVRALNAKLNSVLETVIPKDGGVAVRTEQPESVPTSSSNATVTPPSTAKQISIVTQTGETVFAPESKTINAKAGERIMSISTIAKQLGRPILRTESGRTFLVLGGRKFDTKFSLTESQVRKFLEEEKSRG